MGLAGPLRVLRGGAAPLGGRPQTSLLKPALQGTLGRQVGSGVVATEEDANQSASPSGVLAAQGEGLVAQGVVGLGAAAPAGVVGRGEGVSSLVVEPLEQVSHRA
jgi:hypothetical protein